MLRDQPTNPIALGSQHEHRCRAVENLVEPAISVAIKAHGAPSAVGQLFKSARQIDHSGDPDLINGTCGRLGQRAG